MTTTATTRQTLAAQAWPAATRSLLPVLLIAIAASLLLTLSAKTKVPFWPVPMTMQPFVVLLLGLAFGARVAIAGVLLYLAQGAVGLPVFTDTPARGIGLAYMAGPTGGFLAGFALAALATGWLADRGWTRTIPGALTAALAGLALIYAPGVAWLAQLIGLEKAVTFGVLPFIAKDLVAAALAALVIVGGWRLSGGR